LSAKRLSEEVDRIIDKYQTQGMKCSKVILVTHSMGGLVARYYSECLEGRDKIYGIVHGVMPSVGAAATYTRMKRGTENTES
ncbi:esterase/lipase family protein, partial [Klebsiella pneumoniae]